MNEQEEMRCALVEKFYELSDIHADGIETSQDNVIAAASIMDAIYNTRPPQKLTKHHLPCLFCIWL